MNDLVPKLKGDHRTAPRRDWTSVYSCGRTRRRIMETVGADNGNNYPAQGSSGLALGYRSGAGVLTKREGRQEQLVASVGPATFS